MTELDRIRANRGKRAALDAELPRLVWEAMQAGCTWQQVAEALGVSKQRVYQLRAAGKP
ncbi:hypothetical protein SEA_MINDY_30 [Mycobacterium phage Mindy]|uniref:Helix-turn-helix DNA binding domain protein n=5 Tax=Kostyavirus TaxID=1623284 RepID=G1DHW6_9CAUD|nr:HTH DNA binding protein [Mycobacterium phage Kostya]YP_009208438.1 HTH DNA binding protein [Mycobacterium phage Toto]YP_009225317.1 HTH DNA binding protein [Mycobacterium phage Mindy]AEK08882.1 hypothetical protein PBI_HENRY_31 [Mycobacterium phage Henry]APU02854.1 helix-turn-helix DNA binding protein [Mycobacterium phage CrystalP]QYC54673.1 helix-turn-helix DNA-binding domain protein [Mycobacterium phage ShamWow]ACF34198.1 hypothetical protein Kostya_31 [Mycobacterium phage Kostya]AEJ925